MRVRYCLLSREYNKTNGFAIDVTYGVRYFDLGDDTSSKGKSNERPHDDMLTSEH
jgi:hypothetical protein